MDKEIDRNYLEEINEVKKFRVQYCSSSEDGNIEETT
jgi:hypothetical protein